MPTDRQKGLPKLITEFLNFFNELTGNTVSKIAVLNRYEKYGKYRDNSTLTSKHEHSPNKVIAPLVHFYVKLLQNMKF